MSERDRPISCPLRHRKDRHDTPEQERMEAWIMGEIGRGAALPGLYPMNAETKARYDAFKRGIPN